MYRVTCQNNIVTIERGVGSIRWLADAKKDAEAYVDMYKQAPRDEWRWAKASIRMLTLSEFDENNTWRSPDF